MIVARSLLATALTLALAGPLAAQESGGFVVRLGRDTTGVETFRRAGNRLEVDQVGRAPRVLRRSYVFEFGSQGAIERATATITSPLAPAGAPPVQSVTAVFAADSVVVETRRDTTVQSTRLATPAGTVALASASPWSIYETLSIRLAGQKSDSLRAPAYFLGAPNVSWVVLRKLGRDSVTIRTENDLYHAAIDRAGHLQHVVPLHGTAQVAVDRVKSLDFPAFVASFGAREQQAGALGALSPRDSVKAAVGGASLWIDYGRPSKRGRVVFGGVVPFGEVWRTGANAATQFRTDKALELNGTQVPAGFYTLWTIPSPGGWKLVINGETGQWGTAHKAERDLYTLDMTVSALPQPVERFTITIEPSAGGGVLHMDWDTTRASIPFVVKP